MRVHFLNVVFVESSAYLLDHAFILALVRVQGSKDALCCPVGISKLEYELLGVASFPLIRIDSLVELVESLEGDLGVIERLIHTSHLPLEQVHKEPVAVNESCQNKNR